MKPFWIALGIFGLLFSILFSFRLDVFNKFHLEPATLSPSSLNALPEKDAWMNILLKDRKIGIIHKGTLIATGTYEDLRRDVHAEGADLEQIFIRLTEP